MAVDTFASATTSSLTKSIQAIQEQPETLEWPCRSYKCPDEGGS